eukprot:2564596-Amphidinium_carterae.1
MAGTQTPAFIFSQLAAAGIDEHTNTAAVFFDLSSAFDEVAHDLLFPEEVIQHTSTQHNSTSTATTFSHDTTTSSHHQFDNMIFAIASSTAAPPTDADEARRAIKYMRDHPAVLLGEQLPDSLYRVMTQWVQAWM